MPGQLSDKRYWRYGTLFKRIVRATIDIHPTSEERACVKMWKTCVTLVLLICIQVRAYGPMRPRIGGGVDAQENAWPWIVSLHNPTCHLCGGSLISREWVLSAAHCFRGVNLLNIRVYLGKLTQRGKNKDEFMVTVDRIYSHNLFNPVTIDNDIALLHLASHGYKSHIRPVYLVAHGSDFPVGTRSTVIGWGATLNGENLPYPGILQQAVVPVVDHAQCSNNLMRLHNRIVTNNMICAGFACGGVDANKGDSGGPLMSQHGCWVQHGIVSWGIGCGNPNTPGVYTRVSQYQQWITDTITRHPSTDLPQFIDLRQPPPRQRPQGSIWTSCFRS